MRRPTSPAETMAFQMKERLSWATAAHVLAMSEQPLRVVELHPMSGEYDCLSLVTPDGRVLIHMNRNGEAALAGDRVVSPIWETAQDATEGSAVLALQLMDAAGIPRVDRPQLTEVARSAALIAGWLVEHADRRTRVQPAWPEPTPYGTDAPDHKLLAQFDGIADWVAERPPAGGLDRLGRLFALVLDERPVAMVNTTTGEMRMRNREDRQMAGNGDLRWDDDRLGYAKDDERTAAYRRAQSRWRETVLHLPYGTSGGGSPTGSMLTDDAPRDAQWLTAEAAAFARERTTGKRQLGDASVNTDRLYRNLLSSMPLCFNLFGHLNAHPRAAARVLTTVLRTKVTAIGDMRVEYAPPLARKVLHDATAFDAYVPIHTADGAGFLAIETKYTEPFSPKEYDYEQYAAITNDPQGWFRRGSVAKARVSGTNQLWRNTMLAQLTESTYRDSGVGTGVVLVISAAGDKHAEDAVAGIAPLLKNRDRIRHVLLEDIVAAALKVDELRYWAHLFSARYLSPVTR
ncbi:MAG: hypothetical protein Q7V58_11775 [Actinomycetota bacterium]|nr:hypothetical protein [Actinomycetota bacterium]